jgi:UTP--glucose-1-phosphate uridylyltransferase
MLKPIRKAVLPVAGFGTRVLPATKAIPKEMLPVVDRPAIQYVVDEAFAAGVEHIVFVTGRNKSSIEDYFDQAFELETTLREKGKKDALAAVQHSTPRAGAASFVRQQSALGLGHAVWCARDIIGDEPFAVLLPDVIVDAEISCLTQMVGAYVNAGGGNIIAVNEVPLEEVHKYGVIDPAGPADANGAVPMKGMVEKPKAAEAPSLLSITGRYILQPEIFALLEDQGAGAGGEIQLTDAMARMMKKQPFHALQFNGDVLDCGSKIGYFEAVLAMALKHGEIGAEARALVKKLKL